MPRTPTFPPYPRKPHASGQARIRVAGVDVYLGAFGSPASWAEYQRRLDLWRAGRDAGVQAPAPAGGCRTVADLVAAYLEHARAYYRHADGTAKDELGQVVQSLRPVARLYGDTPLIDFRGPCLRRVRDAMADGSWMSDADRARAERQHGGRGWSRGNVNRMLSRVKACWRWAESEGLVPEGRSEHLATVRGLEADAPGTREGPGAAPVPDWVVDVTLPHLAPPVRALVELLLLTAARPKELRLLRARDLERGGRVELAPGYWVALGPVWAARLERHKTARHRVRRVILFGPQAQQILAPFLVRDADAYLFSPHEACAARGRVPTGVRRPGDHYSRCAFERAVKYGARRADQAARKAAQEAGPLPEPLWAPGAFVPSWHPYQCRHAAATRIVAEFGLETARVILGHTSAEMTRRYGVEDLRRAADAQGRAG